MTQKNKIICLDPGHAKDNYNAGVVPGYYESAIVWKLTMYEKEYLESWGIKVRLTRTNINDDPDLIDRGKTAKGSDLFVSNHTNACATPGVKRAVAIYMTDRSGTTADDKSREFASIMAQTVDNSMGGIGHQTYTKLSSRDRDGDGLKNDNYYAVLHGAFLAGVPGIIMEHGFHTNADICHWLMNDANLRKLALDCAKDMAAYVGVVEADDDVITASDFKEKTREEVLAEIGDLLTEDQKESGILASVSGAQLILESGGLQTELAQNANNCFGMKASLSGNTWEGSVWDGSIYTKKTSEWDGEKYIEVVAPFRKYPDIKHSIADHSAYLLGAMNGNKKRYAGLAGCTDHKTAIQIIKNGGYATSPDYVQKLLNMIDKYDLKRFDCPVEEKEESKPETEVKVEVADNFPAVPFLVHVLIDDLNYRSEPSMNGTVKGATGKGIFTIVEISNGWGRLKSGVGWIYLKNPEYCTIKESVKETVKEEPKFEPYIVRVTAGALNIRKLPTTKSDVTGIIRDQGLYTIVEEDGNWGKLKSGMGWISLKYTKRV